MALPLRAAPRRAEGTFRSASLSSSTGCKESSPGAPRRRQGHRFFSVSSKGFRRFRPPWVSSVANETSTSSLVPRRTLWTPSSSSLRPISLFPVVTVFPLRRPRRRERSGCLLEAVPCPLHPRR
jgi:hypothetical protein